jgi:SAM-dependent methyltransferase
VSGAGEDSPFEGPVPLWEIVLVRVLNLPVVFFARVVDVALLAWRPRLLRAYFGLWLRELFHSPYQWPRSFDSALRLKATGQRRRELLFGEAPAFSVAWLLWRAGLRRGGSFLDVGAGRGRPLLGAAMLGARARGLELLEAHVRVAGPVLARAGVELVVADALTAELGTPSHVLLNWCAFTPATRARLTERLALLPPGTLILAVTVPLDEARFPVRSRHRALFTWGTERVFVHQVPSAGAASIG